VFIGCSRTATISSAKIELCLLLLLLLAATRFNWDKANRTLLLKFAIEPGI
jgi:hypothetical protein